MGLGSLAAAPAAPTLLGRLRGEGKRWGNRAGSVGVGREGAHRQLAPALTPTLPAALHPRRDGSRATRSPAGPDLSPLLGL